MGAFFRIILTAALIFYAFSMIVKLVFRRKVRKLEKQMNQFTQDENKQESNESKSPHVDPNIGEYTDFEEIE